MQRPICTYISMENNFFAVKIILLRILFRDLYTNMVGNRSNLIVHNIYRLLSFLFQLLIL